MNSSRYDPAFIGHKVATIDILRYRAGACTEFVKIFTEMCSVANIESKAIVGFAKGSDWKQGNF